MHITEREPDTAVEWQVLIDRHVPVVVIRVCASIRPIIIIIIIERWWW